jgi:small subunit ribosomal protein S8
MSCIHDSLGDFFTIIRNSILAKKLSIIVPFSNIRLSILKILKNEGLIKNFLLEEENNILNRKNRKSKFSNKIKRIKIILKYVSGVSSMKNIIRCSRPSRRMYVRYKNQKEFLSKISIDGAFPIFILSTSKGILTDYQSRKKHVGGELLAKIW